MLSIHENSVDLVVPLGYAEFASPLMLGKDEDEAAPDDVSQARVTATLPPELVAAALRLTHAMCYVLPHNPRQNIK